MCFVSNNSFLEQIAFDGVRKHLTQDFTHIFHLDLGGNVRKNPKLSGTRHNVFGIQVGVGITILVRKLPKERVTIHCQEIDERWTNEQKWQFLVDRADYGNIAWNMVVPDIRQNWITEGLERDFDAFLPIGTFEEKASKREGTNTIFKIFSRGLATCRDDVVYDFEHETLKNRIIGFIDAYNSEIDRWKRNGSPANVDAFVDYSCVKWSESLKANLQREKYAVFERDSLRLSLYRPFVAKNVYFDHTLNERTYVLPRIFPCRDSETENLTICVNVSAEKPFSCLVANKIPELVVTGGFGSPTQCFPFYVYDEDGSNRRENITDWALTQFRQHYSDPSITKRDIFHYVYAVLHHPDYREKYRENLKRELPRIPFLGDSAEAFHGLAFIGAELADLHLNYETVEPYPLRRVENPNVRWTTDIGKMRWKDKEKTALVYNDSLTLEGFPAKAFEYRLGNRSALDWVVDQYKNWQEGTEYVIELLGRVTTVSLRTVALVEQLKTNVEMV